MKHDILIQEVDQTTLTLTGGKITSLKSQKIKKSAARIFKNQKIFTAAFTGEISVRKLLEMADAAGNVGVDYDYELPSTAAIAKQSLASESRSTGIKRYQEFVANVTKEYSHLNWSGHAVFSKVENSFHSNYTQDLKSSGESLEVGMLYKQFGSTEFADGYISTTGQSYDFSKTLSRATPLLRAFDKKATVESKKMPVLLLDFSDLSQALTRDLKPDKFHQGSSFLSGKMGEGLFSSQVTILDKSYSPEDGQFTAFDGEGVARSDLKLFEQGVFSAVPYDLRTAKKFGKKSTGNGFRSFDSGVMCKLGTCHLSSGTTPMWEMLKSIPECLVVSMAYGGGINEEWEYSNPVQVGFIFRNGVGVGRVPSVSIKGRLGDMLGKDLIGISSDTYTLKSNPAILTQLEVIAH